MFLKYITIASAFNFLFFSFMLLTKEAPNKKANNIMGVFFLLMAIYSGLVSFRFIALINNDFSILKYYSPVDGIFLLLMGPALYFYILSILNKPIQIIKWKSLLHLISFIPFIVFNIYFTTLPFQNRIDWFIHDFSNGTIETNLLNIILYIQMPTYLIVSYFLIKKQLKVSPTIVMNDVQVDISWLKFFLLMNMTFMFVSAPLCFYFANEKANIIIGELAMNIQFLYIYIKSSWHKNMFVAEKIAKIKNGEHVLKIDDETADNFLNILEMHMKIAKPFLAENCNIQSVSESTGISVHQLSYTLNSHLQKSFNDYINGYRIEEAKKILSSDQSNKLTLEAIGYECGFGSKSTFNKAFRKHTNLTPSGFRLTFKPSQQ